jgi:hypothetical protein
MFIATQDSTSKVYNVSLALFCLLLVYKKLTFLLLVVRFEAVQAFAIASLRFISFAISHRVLK